MFRDNNLTNDMNSLAEMFIGIIVLCIPAAARTCRHHSKDYHDIKETITSKILSRPGSRSAASTVVSNNNGRYTDLSSDKTSRKSPYPHLEGPKTTIRSGGSSRGDDTDDDGVRLTFEMKTTVQASGTNV